MSSKIFFVSSSEHKFNEAKNILSRFGIKIEFFKRNLKEIQATSLEEIAQDKALQAFSFCSKPILIEDDGLFIKSLNGFPGPYSSYVLETIGNRGILRLISLSREAVFSSVIAYCEKKQDVRLFRADVRGKISPKIIGRKWGFDPIFVPSGQTSTYSKLKEKNLVSHRYLALRKFANWYLHNWKSSGQ